MYQTSDNYKTKILNIKNLLKVYINGIEIDGDNVKSCKTSQILFTGNEFTFGSTIAQQIEMEVNKLAVPQKINTVYIETGISGEIIPVGHFRLDDPVERNGRICTLKLIDDMVKFEPNYNGSVLNYPCKLKVVLQDICSKMGVELRFYFFFEYG